MSDFADYVSFWVNASTILLAACLTWPIRAVEFLLATWPASLLGYDFIRVKGVYRFGLDEDDFLTNALIPRQFVSYYFFWLNLYLVSIPMFFVGSTLGIVTYPFKLLAEVAAGESFNIGHYPDVPEFKAVEKPKVFHHYYNENIAEEGVSPLSQFDGFRF